MFLFDQFLDNGHGSDSWLSNYIHFVISKAMVMVGILVFNADFKIRQEHCLHYPQELSQYNIATILEATEDNTRTDNFRYFEDDMLR